MMLAKPLAPLLLGAAALFGFAGSAQAQVDWSGMMGTMAQEDAVREAAREGRGSRQVQRPRSRQAAGSASNARARRQCASARNQAADGLRDARLSQILSLCSRAGY